VEIARIQAEIESRFPKIEALRNQNKEADMRLYERDNNIKEIRELEREEEAEMEILLGVKAKKLNERVIFYYLNEMINFCE